MGVGWLGFYVLVVLSCLDGLLYCHQVLLDIGGKIGELLVLVLGVVEGC